jgi:HD-GYP domain-containing protein (c-di-GMP phosphodiesterase class II)
LGSKTALMPDGQAIPFLTEDELCNLTIARGNLNEREWCDMRSHVAKSESYLNRIPWSRDLRHIPSFAGAHHEKLDGTGYPNHLTHDQIPDQVRILTIADIFDAVTAADRPYRDAVQVPRALDILRTEAHNGQLDARFVQIFIEHVVPVLHELEELPTERPPRRAW